MKKLLIALIMICLAIMPFSSRVYALDGEPSTGGDADVQATEKFDEVTAEKIGALTEKLCNDEKFKDRTSFTDSIKTAAEGIAALFDGDAYDVEVSKFEHEFVLGQNYFQTDRRTLASYNVVAKNKDFDKSKKTIVISAPYGNHYAAAFNNNGTGAAGAIYNSATVALTVNLANAIASRDNKYNFVFALFSGTDEGNYGSDYFVKNFDLSTVMLAVNLEKLGGGDTYFYTDEGETTHGDFIAGFSASYDLKQFPEAGRVLLDFSTVDGLDYSHYAMMGDIAPFLSVGKSCLELIGGDFSGLNNGDGVSDGKEALISNTEYDTYDTLVELFPNYADKLSAIGGFLLDLTDDAQLDSFCNGAAESYKVFTQGWIAYVICLGVIIILILVLILVTTKLEKKYPIPPPPKVKVAVFGKEYEDLKDNDIIMDLKFNDNDSNGNNGNNDNNNNNNVNPFDV